MQKKIQTEVSASEYLFDIQDLADAGRYDQAMEMVQEARGKHLQNIFLIALEKQFEKLLMLAKNDELTPSTLDDALSPLPHLIKRAIDDIHNETHGVGETPAQRAASQKEQAANVAAIERLKTQYFQHAEECIQRGDYESALNEIRRVKIIDHSNQQAREFEQRILQAIANQDDTSVVEAADEDPVVMQTPEMDFLEQVKPTGHLEPQSLSTDDLVEFKIVEDSGVINLEPPVAHNRHLRNIDEVPPKKKSSIPFGIATLALILVVAVVMIVRSLVDSEEPNQFDQLPPPVLKGPSTRQTSEVSQQPTVSQVEDINVAPPEKGIETPITPPGTKSENTKSVAQPRSRSERTPRRNDEPKSTISNATRSTTSKATEKPSIPSFISQRNEKANQPVKTAEQEPVSKVVYEERLPQVKRLEQPKFPLSAGSVGINGEVTVRVQVSAEGRPLQAKVVKSSNPLFNDPVIEAVMQSEFEAGTMPSGPVTTWVTIPFKFKR